MATLLAPSPVEAWYVSIFVVALAQEVPMSYPGRGALQEIAHRTLFASCTKWFGTLEGGSRAEELLDAAGRAATSGRLGTAVLKLPMGMLAAPATPSGETPSATGIDVAVDRPCPSARQVEIACDGSAFELLWAHDFALQGRHRCAAGAVSGAVSG